MERLSARARKNVAMVSTRFFFFFLPCSGRFSKHRPADYVFPFPVASCIPVGWVLRARGKGFVLGMRKGRSVAREAKIALRCPLS